MLSRLIPGLMIVSLLAGCTGSPRWGNWSRSPTQANIQAGLHRLDTYAYYPAYQIYFNAARGQYTFWDGRAWVTSNLPPQEIPAELLEISDSVALRFENSAEWHHAEVIRRYPPEWTRQRTTVALGR
jgi:hypothetical protein